MAFRAAVPARTLNGASPFTVPRKTARFADPHFVQGYTIGATFIAHGGERAEDGLRFLQEGERNNPASFEIQTELGRFYLVYRKDRPPTVLPELLTRDAVLAALPAAP